MDVSALSGQATVVARIVANDNDDATGYTSVTVIEDDGSLTPPATGTGENLLDPAPLTARYSSIEPVDLTDVTGLFQIGYTHTSANEETGDHYVGLTIVKDSVRNVRDQLVLAIDNLDSVDVSLINNGGTLPLIVNSDVSGQQYIEIGHLLDTDSDQFYVTDAESAEIILQFRYTGDGQANFEDRERFDYQLSLLGSLNQPPAFTTSPYAPGLSYATIRLGNTYNYPALAVDPDGDEVAYSLVGGPSGMQIDPATNEITWDTAGVAEGTYAYTIRAEDGFGGEATQTVELRVSANAVNIPPQFQTNPLTYAYAGTENVGDAYEDPNLRAHWSFVENVGSTTTDQSGYGNEASLLGDTAWAEGRYGAAVSFDGAGGYLQSPLVLDPGNTPFTATAWIKLDQLPASGASVIVSQQDGTGTGRSWHCS